MGLKSVIAVGLVAALSLALPTQAQYQVLDSAAPTSGSDTAIASDDYHWTIAVDGGVVAMSGSVPYESVANLLSRRAGISADLNVRPDAPLGFLRDALLAIEAVGYLERGEVEYRDGAWTLSGTMLSGEDASALAALLGNPTGAGSDWVLQLDEPTETAETQIVVDPSPLPELRNAELTNRVDALLAEPAQSEELSPEPNDADTPTSSQEETAPDAPEAAESEPTEAVAEPSPDSEAETPQPAIAAGSTSDDDVSPVIETAQAPAEVETIDPAAIEMCKAQIASLLEERSVLFASGRSGITDDSQNLLSDLADVFAICPDAPIYVEGHTDAVGDDGANLVLSLSRAESVVDALVGLGVRPGRLYAVGYGSSLPIASNDTADGRAKNRRIVFNFEDIAAQGGVER